MIVNNDLSSLRKLESTSQQPPVKSRQLPKHLRSTVRCPEAHSRSLPESIRSCFIVVYNQGDDTDWGKKKMLNVAMHRWVKMMGRDP